VFGPACARQGEKNLKGMPISRGRIRGVWAGQGGDQARGDDLRIR
jgi:hypothetical protein